MSQRNTEAPRVVYEGKYQRMLVRGTWEYSERTHAGGLAAIIIAVTPEDGAVRRTVPRAAAGPTIEMPAWSATSTLTNRSKSRPCASWKKKPAGPPITPKC